MIDIRTKIIWNGTLDELDPKFGILRNFTAYEDKFKSWHLINSDDTVIETKILSVIFIGQTGYGKSTLLNKLIGKEVFETSDIEACTKSLNAALYALSDNQENIHPKHYISFVDLPGIGESNKADEKYLQWYKKYIEDAAAVIYLFRADKRDHTADEYFFNNVFSTKSDSKLICTVSQADKIEPFRGEEMLSHPQRLNLLKKEHELKTKSFLRYKRALIVSISSHLDFNIDMLKDEIIYKLIRSDIDSENVKSLLKIVEKTFIK